MKKLLTEIKISYLILKCERLHRRFDKALRKYEKSNDNFSEYINKKYEKKEQEK